ncbi:MAG: SusC/RagA family TonB-linked outer membrane protein [Proteiniphilum sp.]|jgi:TonB-linked SusC/RagA family outer membrane protein|nr:SusC/RagA family TonB-linked outer membrane protein [Proteiniphilum sp.]
MRKKINIFLFLFFLGTGTLFAQTRVTGSVVDEGGEPAIGATILIKGTSEGAVTDNQGVFTITAPSTGTLVISYVGYVTQEVAVRSNVRVVLVPDTEMLEEVVITGEFGMKRIARSVGSAVQNVKASDIIDSGRDNFVSALQGRVSGMNVTSTGGAPGSSTTVVLRNITSISGNNQPLYVIDGVPMNNSTFDPINMWIGGTERYSVRNLDFASRGNDLNPQDIESMTVLKGAAAAALYGSDASNGAIIITTKKGQTGKGRVQYSNSFRWDNAYGFPELQDKYANGAYGTTNYYYTSRFGGSYPPGMKLYDNVGAVMQTGFVNKHNLAVDGGSEKATIRASASFLDQVGVVKTTDYTRMNLSLSGQAKITDWFDFEGSMQYTNTNNSKALRGTDGPLYRAMLWPLVDNMSNYLDADGAHMRYPDYYIDTDLLNPLFAMNRNRYFDKSDRFLTNIAATLFPLENLFLRAQIGWDVGMQTFETSLHPYYAANNGGVGEYHISQSNFSDPTLNILAGYNTSFFNEELTFGAQLGYHQQENGVIRLTTMGSKYKVIDFQSINNTDPATIISAQRNTKRRIQALSAQFEFGYKNIVFLNLRGRNDWSSTLPKHNNRYFYPAMELSFVPSDLSFLKDNSYLSYLKLRGSIAQVGKDAGPLEIDPELIATELTGGGYKYGFTGPNRNLRPEMTTSKEIGFDTRLFNDRVTADFTYFATHCADQIVKGFRLSYATGFVLNNMNVGTFDTWGWETHIDGDIIRARNGLTWNVGLNMSHVKSEIVSLPENVTEYYNPYTWNSGNIRNGIMVGHPITTLTGRAYERNDAGEVLISPTTGLPVVSPQWSVIGDREPKLRFGITTSISFKELYLSAMFSGRYKATVVNGTKRSMMTSGTSWESVTLRESKPVIFNGVLKDGNENTDNPTANRIAVDYSAYGSSIYGGGDEDWLEKDVNYLRLQELRLSYRIPASLLSRSSLISYANIFIAGNDLLTWTNYSGIDAVGNTVSAAAGGTGGEGYDVWSLPNPRSISVGFSITVN